MVVITVTNSRSAPRLRSRYFPPINFFFFFFRFFECFCKPNSQKCQLTLHPFQILHSPGVIFSTFIRNTAHNQQSQLFFILVIIFHIHDDCQIFILSTKLHEITLNLSLTSTYCATTRIAATWCLPLVLIDQQRALARIMKTRRKGRFWLQSHVPQYRCVCVLVLGPTKENPVTWRKHLWNLPKISASQKCKHNKSERRSPDAPSTAKGRPISWCPKSH